MSNSIGKRITFKALREKIVEPSFEDFSALHTEGLTESQMKVFKFIMRKLRACYTSIFEGLKANDSIEKLSSYREIFEIIHHSRTHYKRLNLQMLKFPKSYKKDDIEVVCKRISNHEDKLIDNPSKAALGMYYEIQKSDSSHLATAQNEKNRNRAAIAKVVEQLLKIIEETPSDVVITRYWLQLRYPELSDQLEKAVLDRSEGGRRDWNQVKRMIPKILKKRFRFDDGDLSEKEKEYLKDIETYRSLAESIGPEALADFLVSKYSPHLDFKRAMSIIPRYIGVIKSKPSIDGQKFANLPLAIIEVASIQEIVYLALRRKVCEQLSEELDRKPLSEFDGDAQVYLKRLREIVEQYLDQSQVVHWKIYTRLYNEIKYVLNSDGNGMKLPSRLGHIVTSKSDPNVQYRSPSLVQRIVTNEMQKLVRNDDSYEDLKGILLTLSMGKGKTLGSFYVYEKIRRPNKRNQMIYIVPKPELASEIAAQVKEHYRDGDEQPSTFVLDASITAKQIQNGILDDYEMIIVPYSMLPSTRNERIVPIHENEVNQKLLNDIKMTLKIGGAQFNHKKIKELVNADEKTQEAYSAGELTQSEIIDIALQDLVKKRKPAVGENGSEKENKDKAYALKLRKKEVKWMEGIKIAVHLSRLKPTLIVPDEPQNADKPTKAYTVALRELVQLSEAPFLMLSGTPAPNGPQDLGPQFALARPDLFESVANEIKSKHSEADLRGVTMRDLLNKVDPIRLRTAFMKFNLCLESPQTQWEKSVNEVNITLEPEVASMYEQTVQSPMSVGVKFSTIYKILKNPRLISPTPVKNIFLDETARIFSEALFDNGEGSALMTECFRLQGMLTRMKGQMHVPSFIEQLKFELDKKHGLDEVQIKVLHGSVRSPRQRQYLLDWIRFPEWDYSIRMFQIIRALYRCDEHLNKASSNKKSILDAKQKHQEDLMAFTAQYLHGKTENSEKHIPQMREIIASGATDFRKFRRILVSEEYSELHTWLKSIEPPQKKRILAAWESIIREGINLFEVSTMVRHGFGFRKDDDAQIVKRVDREGTSANVYSFMLEGLILEGIKSHKEYKDHLSKRMIYGGTLNPEDLDYVEGGDHGSAGQETEYEFIVGSRASDLIQGDRQRLMAMNRALENQDERELSSSIDLFGEEYAEISAKYSVGSESSMTNRVVSSVLLKSSESLGNVLSKVADLGAGLLALENTLGVVREDITITSFDLNQSMTDEGQKLLEKRRGVLHRRPDIRICPLTKLQAIDESFDAVNIAHVMHNMGHSNRSNLVSNSDRAKALVEINRVLKIGGVLTMTIPEDFTLEEQRKAFVLEMKNIFGFELLEVYSGKVESDNDKKHRKFETRLFTFKKSATVRPHKYNSYALSLNRPSKRSGASRRSEGLDQYQMHYTRFKIKHRLADETLLEFESTNMDDYQAGIEEEYLNRVKKARERIHSVRKSNNGTLVNLPQNLIEELMTAFGRIQLMSFDTSSSSKSDTEPNWIFSLEGYEMNAHPVDLNTSFLGDEEEEAIIGDDDEDDEFSSTDEDLFGGLDLEVPGDDVDVLAGEMGSEEIESKKSQEPKTPSIIDKVPIGLISEENKKALGVVDIIIDGELPLVVNYHGEILLTQVKNNTVEVFNEFSQEWISLEDEQVFFEKARRTALIDAFELGEVSSLETFKMFGCEESEGESFFITKRPDHDFFGRSSSQLLSARSTNEYLVFDPSLNTWYAIPIAKKIARAIAEERNEPWSFALDEE
ncbi:MAG: methyltransferase domain-containing protein [Candidatus Gracilibacteria bacterium]|nr:methyltransferase domain-containing protein [Candidatus Gracilibacteria bacterium]